MNLTPDYFVDETLSDPQISNSIRSSFNRKKNRLFFRAKINDNKNMRVFVTRHNGRKLA